MKQGESKQKHSSGLACWQPGFFNVVMLVIQLARKILARLKFLVLSTFKTLLNLF